MGVMLLGAFVGSSGWYFWAFYRPPNNPIPVREKILTPHDELFAVHIGESERGWVVGKYGLILRTGDGGRSWTVQKAGTTRTLTSVSFANDQRGFAVGSGGLILATIDGGLSWNAQSSPTKNHLLSVYAPSQTKAYAVGAFGTILSTSNGGAMWRKDRLSWENLIPVLIRQAGYLEPNLNAVCFVNPEVGWIVGEFGLVLHTRDGGQTWTLQRHGRDLPELAAVKFRDERIGFAVGQQGTLIKTRDGGKSWVEMKTGTKGLYGIALSGQGGVIVGDGVVWKTEDGGSNWAQVRSVPPHLWLGGVALKGKKGAAVGQAGTLLRLDLETETVTPLEQGSREKIRSWFDTLTTNGMV